MRHDFRNSRWGHNIDAKVVNDLLSGFSWSTPALKLGDEIVYNTNYGWAVAEVVVCHNYRDPYDMTDFKAEITERHLSEESQALVDSGEVDSPPWL